MPEPSRPALQSTAPVRRLPTHELNARRRRKRHITELPGLRRPAVALPATAAVPPTPS